MYEELKNKKEKIVVVGMGYVGFPLAIHFAKAGFNVIGFDINSSKIEQYKNGFDPTNEVGSENMKDVVIEYTSDAKKIGDGKFIIVAVPTPVRENNMPDLYPVEAATELVALNMKEGSIVVYESTVYPGVTEEVCVPILEKHSGLKQFTGFNVGYSPERINPGDKVNTLESVVKIVSGDSDESLEIISNVYGSIIKAGICKASCIKVAEAAKVTENTQRDVNIGLVNELSEVFERLGIDTNEVMAAAGTKWNFNVYHPGLVGGHCIGVDPYYLIHKAEENGYTPQIMKAVRSMNDHVSERVVNKITTFIQDKNVINPKALVLGLTFKENVPDIRNSKVYDVIKGLIEKGVDVDVHDPYADKDEVKHEYNLDLIDDYKVSRYDVVVIATAHNEYREIAIDEYINLMNDNKIMIDLKAIVDYKKLPDNVTYWRL